MQLSVQAGGPDCVNSSYILGEKVVFSYTAVARHYRSRVKLDNIKFRDEYLYQVVKLMISQKPYKKTI